MLNVEQLAIKRDDQVLHTDLGFSLQRGDILHLQGRNGVGKTTLLRILAGFIPVERGTVCWSDVAIAKQLKYYQQQLHWVGHHVGFNLRFSIQDSLRYQLALYGKPTSSLDFATDIFNLVPILDKPLSELSRGQLQKVGLVRLTLCQRVLWLLDEPFTALDLSAVEMVVTLMKQHQQQGGMIVIASHQALPEELTKLQTLHL